jgi:PilZ domain
MKGEFMKQRNLRIGLKNDAGLFWRGLDTPASIENISVTGALVRADRSVKVGDFMVMHLEDKSWPGAMEMGAEVIRIGKTRSNMPAFALQFLKVPEDLRVFLRHTSVKHNATIGT